MQVNSRPDIQDIVSPTLSEHHAFICPENVLVRLSIRHRMHFPVPVEQFVMLSEVPR